MSGQRPNYETLEDLGINWEALPNLRQVSRDREMSSACPFCGGTDRFHIMLRGSRLDPVPHAWCRQCGKRVHLKKVDRTLPAPLPRPSRDREPEIDQSLAAKWHQELTPGARAYFNGRGISDAVIDRYVLGWRPDWRRYSIPCYVGERLYAIQYRSSNPNCPHQKRYFSEAGGVNKVLFNTQVARATLPYIMIIEGPLDCLALASLGFPAVASFSGNQAGDGGWDERWNRYLFGIDDRIVVPDNDASGTGDVLAEAKLRKIPGSRVWRLPAGIKDTGELIKAGMSVQKWLMLPPALTI